MTTSVNLVALFSDTSPPASGKEALPPASRKKNQNKQGGRKKIKIKKFTEASFDVPILFL